MDRAHSEDMETDGLCRDAQEALRKLVGRARILPGLEAEMEAMVADLQSIRDRIVATWD